MALVIGVNCFLLALPPIALSAKASVQKQVPKNVMQSQVRKWSDNIGTVRLTCNMSQDP